MSNELIDSIKTLKNNIKELKKTKNDKVQYLCFEIIIPEKKESNKKFIAVLFGNEKEKKDNNISYIQMIKKKYNIINYCLTLKIEKNYENNFCSFSLAVKENCKIKIIKGSKLNYYFNENNNENVITIYNTIIYNSICDEELYLIASLTHNYTLISEKSYIKILCI